MSGVTRSLVTRSPVRLSMLLFSPSSLLTLDIIMEAVAAPMEDGALIMPRLPVDPWPRPAAPRLDLDRDGLPLMLLPFPGKARHAWTWFPYGLYDAALLVDMLPCCLDIAGVADMSPRVLTRPCLYGARYHDETTDYTSDSLFLHKGLSR